MCVPPAYLLIELLFGVFAPHGGGLPSIALGVADLKKVADMC